MIGGRDRQRRSAEDVAPVLDAFHRLLEGVQVELAPRPLQDVDQAGRRCVAGLANVIDVDAEPLPVTGGDLANSRARIVRIRI